MYNNMKSVTNEYQRQKILTASPAELTMMLYNGCIKNIKIGIECIKNNKLEKANVSIKKAQDIIAELMATLDVTYDISSQMSQIYDFIYNRLVDGNMKKDIEMLNEALELVVDFRDTWYQVMKETQKNAV